MILLRTLLENTEDNVLDLVRANLQSIVVSYEDWLETQLYAMVDEGDITPNDAYDTLWIFRQASDDAEEFLAYIKYRHKLRDTESLRNFILRYL
jgi:hypothetical protein